MTDKEIEKLIEDTARKVVAETKRQMILKDADKMAEKDMSDLLKSHFRSKRNKKLERVLKELDYDPYFNIITLYYRDGYTLESVAEDMNCDISTVLRNKKRLCRIIYKKML